MGWQQKQPQQLVTYQEALEKAVDSLTTESQIKVGGFFDFIKDVWSKGYERPELFNSWHIELICDDVERSLQEKKHYAAVIPRYHLKSTILGHGFSIWMFLKNWNPRFASNGMYLSYSDGMSQYHIAEINKAVRQNEVLREWLVDKSPQADYAFRYAIQGVPIDIMHGGLFSFKRGSHVNRFLIADDILRDPDNPLNLTQLVKIEEHFMTESMQIPVGDSIVIVLGTPMAPNDLLTQLQYDERFNYRFLPALDPIEGHRVLCPAIRTEEWLLREQKTRPRSFSSEFMLLPYLASDAYLNDAEIRKCENSELVNLGVRAMEEFGSECTVAGFDVGKKRHPSHLSIFATKDGKAIQVFQRFLDNWNYTDQKAYLNQMAEDFGIDKAYYDNTRGELEEMGLSSVWRPMIFSAKSKGKMAQTFEEYVVQEKIEFIADERHRSQITCVDGNLNAPATPMGHGDSFFSNAMACVAHTEMISGSTRTVGDLQGMIGGVPDSVPEHKAHMIELLFDTKDGPQEECPSCSETAGWIALRGLCLICEYRRSEVVTS